MHTPMFLQILKTREEMKIAHINDHDSARVSLCFSFVARSSGGWDRTSDTRLMKPLL